MGGLRWAAGAVLLSLVLTACGSGAGARDRRGAVTVFAAASLTESFTALERAFEADHPGVDVRVNYAGSAALAQQIVNGARADVFAGADQSTMDTLVAANLAVRPAVFATNRLAIAVPPGNPRGIGALADLANDAVTVVLCAPRVPCGAAAARAARAAGVTLRPASEEQDVKAVLTKVVAGEADAGLVYATDVVAARGAVTGIEFAQSANAVNAYPIAAMADAPQPELAREFVGLVLGDAGRRVLADAGFGPP